MPLLEGPIVIGHGPRRRLRLSGNVKRRRLHQITFSLAGLYNVTWGICSSLGPQWFFRYTGMPLLNHPEIFVCLAMVIGLYGILYLDVAREPERGWLIAAIGMMGKILGPFGALRLISSGQWPSKAVILCVWNDATWWVPFGIYLFDAWSLSEPKSRGRNAF